MQDVKFIGRCVMGKKLLEIMADNIRYKHSIKKAPSK